MPVLNSLAHAQTLASKGAFLGFRPFISSINLSSSTINEGSTLVIDVNTVNVPNYTTINYTISGISAADVSIGNLSGTLNILNNQATSSISLTFVEDYLLEGNETITMTFEMSQRATHVAQATLADTSRPTFEITSEPSDTSVVFFGNTSLSVSVSAINNGSGTYTYKWQRSIDSGVTWSDLVANSTFLNVTTSQLTLEKWNINYSSSFHNALFRCIIRDAANQYTVTTRAATLYVINPPYGAVVRTTPGTASWTVPANVYAISAVLVGGGGGGAGNYVNPNYWEGTAGGGGGGGGTLASGLIKVTPGETLTVFAGQGGAPGGTSSSAGNGGNSSITFPATGSATMAGTMYAGGGGGGGIGGYSGSIPKSTQYRYGVRGAPGVPFAESNITGNRYITSHLVGNGGGGGLGAIAVTSSGSYYPSSGSSWAGGGAGGYGGVGGYAQDSTASGAGYAGAKGGGGGGGGCGVPNGSTNYSGANNAGGGVGIFGKGSDGIAGAVLNGGGGGSGGTSGGEQGGGLYGGGGQARQSAGKHGANGAVRIIFGIGNSNTLRSYAAENDTFTTSNTVTI